MSDISKSFAFREFLQKRCEEIIQNDKEYCEINGRIMRLEKSMRAKLSSGDIELFTMYEMYERLNSDIIAYIIVLIYQQALRDFKKIN